ncbi:HAMP domain-containing protein [Altererythrobacter xixiisoli]|uniref:Signal transduction histidine-protein kinase/phosphatase MprB n=1 Tax=Croceibacterium xixiisoli TaxID=1476466 RepID=A0A6I4TNP0_9SPHN|nr:ATP-binding protein [Croceibacterium xixiisoli]MXO97492.1 HAMP domain-containing protein [Croceibacterium xixiisoli]
MKSRLFLKILLAFWLTFILMTQGLWLLFMLNNDRRGPPEQLMAEFVAPTVLAAAVDTVARSGPGGIERLQASLPADQAKRLTLVPVTDQEPAPERLITRMVRAPDGQNYRIGYRHGGDNPREVPLLNAPPELLLVGVLGGLLFSGALAWYLTAPINRLRRGFEQLAGGDLTVRLAPAIGHRRDELADLGRDFDLMARRLAQLVEARDRLLHHVSHELRSPLARLQLAIALGRDSDRGEPADMTTMVSRIERESARLEALVAELLTLARAESGQSPGDDYFDLAGVVASVVEDARFEAQAQNIRIDLIETLLPEDDRPPLKGNAELVRRAIDNIVRNALRFSPPGSTLTIAVDERSDPACSRITVLDEGPGIPEAEIGAIFEPFVRGAEDDQPGSGFGLGLTIASRAIAAHGGRLTAENRPSGGLQVTIALPIHPPQG